MRSEYPASYGRVHPETANFALSGAIMSMYAEIEDVREIAREVLRDGADGSIDDANLLERVKKEVTEMIQSAQRVRTLVSGSKK